MPRCARRRRSMRSRRCSRRAGSTTPTRRRTWRRLSPAAHGRAPRADGRRRADAPASARPGGARQCRAAARARRAGTTLLDLLRPHVEQVGDDLRQPRAATSAARCRTTPTSSSGELRALGLRRPRSGGAARRATGARARRGRCARPPRSRRSRRCFPALLQAIAAGADPEPRAQSAQRHRRAAVERGEFLPVARGAAAARASCSPRSSPMRRRWPTSSARRPELFEGLFDASSFAMPPPADEFAELLGRRDARASPMTSRSTARGGWSTSGGSRSASS